MTPTNDDWVHPYGMIINGSLERGLEIAISEGFVQDLRTSTKPCQPFVISPGFVNSHSHLEYRGMLDQIEYPEYYEWIYELTRLKTLETDQFVRSQCFLAARENLRAGIRRIAEHSDRPGSAEAMARHGLGGWVFQEVITSGSLDVAAKLLETETKMQCASQLISANFADKASASTPHYKSSPGSIDPLTGQEESRSQAIGLRNDREWIGTSLSPHAYFTVNHETLKMLGVRNEPISIHVAETEHETNFTKYGKGPIAERRTKFGVPFEVYGQSVVAVLDDLGVLRNGTQCVHCCSVDEDDIEILANRGVTIAHCPRSNVRLQCPEAPVREFLDAGITVGLGMDSPASSGKIDMFAEMRAALDVSDRRGRALTGEEVWRMATCDGYRSFGQPDESPWDVSVGSTTPIIRIDFRGDVINTEDIIRNGFAWTGDPGQNSRK